MTRNCLVTIRLVSTRVQFKKSIEISSEKVNKTHEMIRPVENSTDEYKKKKIPFYLK